jgi:hypothetical protein
MQNKNYTMPKVPITIGVIILIFGWLFWEHLHGGVPSHHILQQKDLPEISNWWGGLVLPVLTWIALVRIERRINKQTSSTHPSENQTAKILGLFSVGLIFGLLIAISFANDYKFFLDNILYVFLVVSFIVPIYYSEFIVGFVFGMTYTFGAILPTIFILIVGGLGFLVYRSLRSLILRVTKVFSK